MILGEQKLLICSNSLIRSKIWRRSPKRISTGNRTSRSYVTFCTIWYHLHNLKNVKKTMEECYIQNSCRLQPPTKSNTPPWLFFTFLKLYKWYQIAQSVAYDAYIHSSCFDSIQVLFVYLNVSKKFIIKSTSTCLIFICHSDWLTHFWPIVFRCLKGV